MAPRNYFTANQELAALKAQGVVLPKNPHKARTAAAEYAKMVQTPGQLQKDVAQLTGQNALLQQMKRNRRFRTAGASDAALAIPRFYDPLEYWDLSGLPWNMADEGHRHKLHKWMRLFYATHYLVPILIDIFTRFPLAGLEVYHHDREIQQFYEHHFLDELQYEDFLVSLGREVWTVGEGYPLGSFNESVGVWEREELLNPEDIVIERFPILGSQQLKLQPPDYLVQLATTKQPPREYKLLTENFPELIPYLMRKEPIPISNVLLKQVAFKTTPWDDHGTPLLLRGLRTLIHEEKLLASQDAIAERLYSPLILAKLGVNELGGGTGPWIPQPGDLDQFRDDMDLALSSDFRLMVYHYALEVENVFGREQVPDLGSDFDRIERRLMQIFGINPSLLAGGSGEAAYASTALHAEFMNQMLRTYQKYLKDHFHSRAAVVAEAQGHYEYEKKGDTRIPIMEEVIEYDDDGNPFIAKKHKLAVPELQMQVLDMRDEATERQFLASLRSMGVPVSDQHLMVGISWDYKDSLDEMSDEMVQKTLASQLAKMKTYKALKAQGLPIPPDLKAEVESIDAPAGAAPAGGPPGGPMGGPPPGGGGMGMPMGGPPPGGGGGMPLGPGAGPAGMSKVPGGGPPTAAPMAPGPAGTVPPQSTERMPGMPRATSSVSKEAAAGIPNSESVKQLEAAQSSDLSFDLDAVIAKTEAMLEDIEVNKRERRASTKRTSRKEPDGTDA